MSKPDTYDEQDLQALRPPRPLPAPVPRPHRARRRRPGPRQRLPRRLRQEGRRRRADSAGRRRRRPDRPDLQLAALYRQEDGRRFQAATGITADLHRGRQRQQRVLRQDRRAAQAGPEHRPRHHRAHRLDGGPPDQAGLHPADRRRQVPQQGQPGRQPARTSASIRAAVTACRGCPGMTGIGYNPKKTGRELTSVNDIFDPKFKGQVTMLTEMRDTLGLVMLGDGQGPRQLHRGRRQGGLRQDQEGTARTATSAASPATTTPRTSRPATSRWRSPGRATSRASRRTTPTCGGSRRRKAPCSTPTTC